MPSAMNLSVQLPRSHPEFFWKEDCYRIGGDEFTVFLTNGICQRYFFAAAVKWQCLRITSTIRLL